MRPDAKHQRSARRRAARAATRITAHLRWLHGFPAGHHEQTLLWHTFAPEHGPLGQVLLRDRTALRAAEHALNSLDPTTLRDGDDLIPDPDAWPDRVRVLLHHLKQHIHHAEPLPEELPEALATLPAKVRRTRTAIVSEAPELRPLVAVFSWAYFLDPDRHATALIWLQANVAQVRVLTTTPRGLPCADRAWLCALEQLAARHGPERTSTLLSLLAKYHLHTAPIDSHEISTYLGQWIEIVSGFNHKGYEVPNDFPPLPPTTIHHGIKAFAEWLFVQPAAVQAHALTYFNLLADETLGDCYVAFADDMLQATKMARRLLREPVHDSTTSKQRLAALERLEKLHRTIPTDGHLAHWPTSFAALAAPRWHPLHDDLSALLARLPHTPSCRLRTDFWNRLQQLAASYQANQLPTLVADLRAYLSRHPEQRLQPWQDAPKQAFRTFVAVAAYSPVQRQRFYTALQQLVADGVEVDATTLDMLDNLTSNIPDGTCIVPFYHELRARNCLVLRCWPFWLPTAWTLHTAGLPFGATYLALSELPSEIAEHVQHAVSVLASCHRLGIAAYFASRGEYRYLKSLGARLVAYRDLPPLPETNERVPVPSWAERYPVELHPVLQLLATQTPRAERLATRILHKDCPANTALEREIAVLSARVLADPTQHALAKRLANLQQRLGQATRLSADRFAHLQEQLERSSYRAWVEDWLAELQQSLRTRWEAHLGFAVPEWLLEPKNVLLLTAIDRCEARFRELSYALVRRRCGPPPWNFHHEPANQHYLAKLRKRGLDPRAWLEGLPAEHGHDATGQRITVRLEDDPFEVLRMGEPFDSCLSPRNSNFFSAIANAVDVNKRVVYARTPNGTIVGRCLLALTDQGRLLTFRIYQNVAGLDLAPIIQRLVFQLTTRLRTNLAQEGYVPPLVAPNWYDDGPRDIGMRFPFLAEDSPFRVALRTIPLEAVPAALADALGAELAVEQVWLPLLDLPEFDRRPELLQPLLAQLEHAELQDSTRWRIGVLAHALGETALARRYLNRGVLPGLVRAINYHGITCHCCVEPVLQALKVLDPSTGLQALRRTRSSFIRRDDDEIDPRRLFFLALMHEQLGRTALAQRLRAKPQNR